ncbi:MAG: HAMP domain-containing protein [Chromatiales bacterium]|nr:HAMP domain-containing protein [Gammaproteobacteria bacterium]MBW6476133.1 HAMP domain-containing protein [Chromatiales bacterium]
MVIHTLKRLTTGPKPVILLFVLLLTSLYLMSAATQHSAQFGRLYSWILATNIFAILLLLALIGRNLILLVQQYRRREAGSRLTVRLLLVFIILAVAPISVLYYFSLQFIHRGIDSWFDLRIERALEDSLELGRGAIDSRLRELVRQTRQQVQILAQETDSAAVLRLHDLRINSEAVELTLLNLSGRVLGSSSLDPTMLIPTLPNTAILQQLRSGIDYVGAEPVRQHGGMHMRIVMQVPNPSPLGEPRLLHALYTVPERLDTLASNVQQAYTQYSELEYLRQPLKYSFTLTLSLVLLLTLLTAVWAAFFLARRLTAPIRDLAEGTRAVAAGDYDMRLPMSGHDELGFLVVSFNDMTRRIARARDEIRDSQQQAEQQRAYVEAVLACLSSGVITLDELGCLRTANSAARQILNISLNESTLQPLHQLADDYPSLAPLLEVIQQQLSQPHGDWQAEVVLFGPSGRQILICRGSALRGDDQLHHGHVIVFDDVTALIQAQRDAAWGEVARRLAHEIKNPLTPIQLSAERMRHKYLASMSPEEAELLDRSTHTIVQQVESMKEMVKAFSDYARPPLLQLQPLDLPALFTEVLDLYRGDLRLHYHLQMDEQLPRIEADPGRMRQLLHNLIKNSIEAAQPSPVQLRIEAHCAQQTACRFIEIRFQDDGPGFPDKLLGQLFEPYVSNKPKGTGLGLAIAKKIVEEHGGILWAGNLPQGGAQIGLRLPIGHQDSHSDTMSASA